MAVMPGLDRVPLIDIISIENRKKKRKKSARLDIHIDMRIRK